MVELSATPLEGHRRRCGDDLRVSQAVIPPIWANRVSGGASGKYAAASLVSFAGEGRNAKISLSECRPRTRNPYPTSH
jgi:hypothetical protein